MGWTTKALQKVLGQIVPQYFSDTNDDWEPVKGEGGAINTRLTGSNVADAERIPIKILGQKAETAEVGEATSFVLDADGIPVQRFVKADEDAVEHVVFTWSAANTKEIRDTSNHSSDIIDVSNFIGSKSIMIRNLHDQTATIRLYIVSPLNDGHLVNVKEFIASASSLHFICATGETGIPTIAALLYPFTKCYLRVNYATPPTTGSIYGLIMGNVS